MSGEAKRENSLVLMLTESGLILNLPKKKSCKKKKKSILAICLSVVVFIYCSRKVSAHHLVRRSRASIGAGYRERRRISTDTTEEDGFFSIKVFA